MPSHCLEEEGGEGEEEETGESEMQFHVEMEDAGGAPAISDVLAAVHSQRSVMTNEMAEKLDIMMSICFEYLHSCCHSNGKHPIQWVVVGV